MLPNTLAQAIFDALCSQSENYVDPRPGLNNVIIDGRFDLIAVAQIVLDEFRELKQEERGR